MTRPDLLALTPDALVALSNRGLVKRALREIESGTGPAVSLEADGALVGSHPDGASTTLPARGGLEAATCTCGATGICRHVIALVLAHRGQAPAPPAEVEAWSPAEFTDEDLADLIGSHLLAAARRAYGRGYSARVRRPSPADPVPSVELPSCTVRFLVPHDLGYARTDAARGSGDETIALAVWAFRAADAATGGAPLAVSDGGAPLAVSDGGAPLAVSDGGAPLAVSDGGDIQVDVGGSAIEAMGTGLDPALALAADVLSEGVVHIGPAVSATVARVRRALDAAGLRWPLLAVDELAEQLDGYRARAATYRPERVAELIAELHGRHRAVHTGGASPRTRVLGTEEAAETAMRRARLVGLGCRVTGTDDDRGVDVFLGHSGTGTVLVLRRRWELADERHVTGHDLARRRVGGVPVAALAAGNVVTESAHRSASRVVRLATSRIAKTSVTPSEGSWDSLPETVLLRDVRAQGRSMADLPPRFVRPRVEAEFVRAVAVAGVLSVGYRPGDQRLEAVIADPAGGTALVSLTHSHLYPAALDALAEALHAGPSFISGALRRSRGDVVIDPLAVVAGGSVIVPALAAGDGATDLEFSDEAGSDPLEQALDAASGLLADAVHRGLRHLPAGYGDRLGAAADALARVGLVRAAESLRGLAGALAGSLARRQTRRASHGEALGSHADAVDAWVDAQIRLLVTADLR